MGLLAVEELVDLCDALCEDLDAAFAEVTDAEEEYFADLFGGGGFGDGDEGDFPGVAVGLGAGGRDAFAEFVEFVRQNRSLGHARLLVTQCNAIRWSCIIETGRVRV